LGRFRYTTIDRFGDSLGHTAGIGHFDLEDITPETRMNIDAEVSILFAGAAAEERFAGHIQ